MSKTAKTPEQHLKAAKALVSDWRAPFISEFAAWPHYVTAANAGIPDAECTVGMAYLYRHYHMPFDHDKARYWLKRSSANGNISAQRELKTVETVPAT